MTNPELTTPNNDPAREADNLIGLGRCGQELRTKLIEATRHSPAVPEAERYAYLHGLADKCVHLVGSQQIPGGSMHIRMGVETRIMNQVLRLPGITQQPERLRDTHVRLFGALSQDLSDLPPRTSFHGSTINAFHDETRAALRQSATAVLRLTPDSSAFSAVREQAKRSLKRPTTAHIQLVWVAPEYL